MRKLYALRAYLTLCILAVSSLIGGVSAQAQETTETFYKTLLFGSSYNSKGISSYTDSWYVTVENFVWDIENFNNNNNGWSYVKCGHKKGASVATIKTREAIDQPVTKVVVTVDNVTVANVNSTTLTVASDAGFKQDVQTVTGQIKKGDVVYSIGNPKENSYYKLTFDCKIASNNGVIQISKVGYYVDNSGKETPEISFSEGNYTMNLGTELTVKATTTSDAKISYTSSDPEVAAIDAETGVVTAKKEGKVTITAKVEATETYTAKSATCELTVTDPRTAPEFSFAEALYTVNIDQTMQIKPVTNSTGVVSYASSDATVAEIDAEGNVTAKAEGEATITATIAATDEFKSATTTCLVKVVDPNKPAEVVTPVSFRKVTSVEELMEGGQYIIVCENSKVAMAAISNKKGTSAKVTLENDNSIRTVPEAVVVYTMSSVNNGYFNLIDGNGKMLGISSATGTDLANLNADKYEAKAQWTLDDKRGIACKANTDEKRAILYNGSLFGHYAVSNLAGDKSTYSLVQLYRLETSATINEKVGYTTFYTDKKYQMPAGLTAYAIAQAEETGTVTMQQAYGEGENVPAYTALLMGGEAGMYRLPVLNTEVPAYEGNNLLEGRRSADNMTSSERENVLYYKLTLLGGENPGFYWGAEGGAAFVMKNPTTAYLAVPETVVAANGFRLVMGDATGIGSVTAAAAQDSAAIYTLSGVRVNATTAAGLPKGIYIVNGRKLLVK